MSAAPGCRAASATLFGDNSDDSAPVSTHGLDCKTAQTTVKDIREQHDPWSDPPNVTVDGFVCTFELGPADEASETGKDICSDGSRDLSFEFYSGE